MSTLETNLIQPATGTALQVGASGDTITVPSGATIVNSGTATGFGGGKVLQVLQAELKQNFFKRICILHRFILVSTLDITPSATTSKILVMTQLTMSLKLVDNQL